VSPEGLGEFFENAKSRERVEVRNPKVKGQIR
jgi:hypothetical protein